MLSCSVHTYNVEGKKTPYKMSLNQKSQCTWEKTHCHISIPFTIQPVKNKNDISVSELVSMDNRHGAHSRLWAVSWQSPL